MASPCLQSLVNPSLQPLVNPNLRPQVLSRLTPSLYDFSVHFRLAQAPNGSAAAGGPRTSDDVLAPQCPARFATGEAILCQWHNPACSGHDGSRVRELLRMADGAGRFQ